MQSPAIIKCHRMHLESRCEERGYSLEEVMPCVLLQEGDLWTIDTSHAAFPLSSRLPPKESDFNELVRMATGPGAELKKLLAGWPFRITATDTCPCNAMAHQMNAWGCDECELRMDEIVAHLRVQAEKRGLPFLDAAGRFLVNRAIKNARKNQH
jgi:hypothetical protein